MKLFPRRALVALGLAVAAVASAAAPAYASNQFIFTAGNVLGPQGYGSDGAWGALNAYNDPANNYGLSEEAWAVKQADTSGQNLDQYQCTEVWVDWDLNAHRPPDVYTQCRVGTYYAGILPIHWPQSDSRYGQQVWDSSTTDHNFKVDICQIDVRNFGRNADPAAGAVECISNGHPVGSITNHDYVDPLHPATAGMSLGGIQTSYGCGPSCYKSGVSLMPEYINHGNIDLLYPGEGNDSLQAGSLMVSWDGSHRLIMQHDGNLVLQNFSGSATWAMSSCLTAGHTLVPGSRAVLYSNGVLDVWTPNNVLVWSSSLAGYNACAMGVQGGSSPYLKMQSDGNLVTYSTGGVLWSTGTAGR